MASLQTLCRTVRAPSTFRAPARALSMGVTQARRLSTGTPDRDVAVRDPIMDKVWGVDVDAVHVAPVSPASTSANTSTSTFTPREPPLGTAVFDIARAPRWSEPSAASH
ncbi:hypothetical protein ACJ41O_011513 [Fusarium nematophilum]